MVTNHFVDWDFHSYYLEWIKEITEGLSISFLYYGLKTRNRDGQITQFVS